MFVIQDQLVKEVGPEGFFKDVITSIDLLGGFVNDTLDEIEVVAIKNLNVTAYGVINTLGDMPDKTL